MAVKLSPDSPKNILFKTLATTSPQRNVLHVYIRDEPFNINMGYHPIQSGIR